MISPKKNDKVTIKIPRPLYNHIKLIKENLGFNSVTDFVVYLLRNIASSGRPKGNQNHEKK
jgi:hypothetical protein